MFQKKKEEQKAYCGGTSNLREHLETAHSSIYKRKRLLRRCQLTTVSSIDRSFFKASDGRAERIVGMIIVDMRPIRVVECEGFRHLLNVLEPGFVM